MARTKSFGRPSPWAGPALGRLPWAICEAWGISNRQCVVQRAGARRSKHFQASSISSFCRHICPAADRVLCRATLLTDWARANATTQRISAMLSTAVLASAGHIYLPNCRWLLVNVSAGSSTLLNFIKPCALLSSCLQICTLPHCGPLACVEEMRVSHGRL